MSTGSIVRLSLAGRRPGAGESRRRKSRRSDLAAQVKLCGLLDAAALRDLLRSGDLYVLPSIGMEAFSISALEGACVGLPLLLSDQVGLAGFLDRGRCRNLPRARRRRARRALEKTSRAPLRYRLDRSRRAARAAARAIFAGAAWRNGFSI